MEDNTETKQEAPEAPAQTAQQPTHKVKDFHEDEIKTQDGFPCTVFTQYNPQTGWAWIGVKLDAVSPFTARAIFASHDATIMLEADRRQSETMRKAAIANGVKQPAGRGVPMPDFVRKLMKH